MTTCFKFDRVLRAALATALVFGAQIVSAHALSANVGTGSVVHLNWSSLGSQADGNGAFSGSVISGPGAGSSFVSFCLEKNETAEEATASAVASSYSDVSQAAVITLLRRRLASNSFSSPRKA